MSMPKKIEAGPQCLAKFQVKERNCQGSLDMLCFFASMVGGNGK